MDCHCHPRESLYSLFPSSYPFAEEQWEGDLADLCHSWGHIIPHWMSLCWTFPAQTLALLTEKAALIHHFPYGLQEHEISTFINLWHINFTPLASDESDL